MPHFHPPMQDVDKTLHVKGTMLYIKEWQSMLFLACPIMKDLSNLVWTGLFINELRYASFRENLLLT